MKVSIQDINYSATAGAGEYSSLNSKLYLMDALEMQTNDGTAAQATVYDSSNGAANSSYQQAAIQTEQQEVVQFEATNNIGEILQSEQLESFSESALPAANPTTSTVNAIATSSPVIGLDEAAVQEVVASYSEIAGAGATIGAAGEGGGFGGNTAPANTDINVTNASHQTNNNSETLNLDEIITSIENLNVEKLIENLNIENINDIINMSQTLIENSVDQIETIIGNTIINPFENTFSKLGFNVGLEEIQEQVFEVSNTAVSTIDEAVETVETVITNTLDDLSSNITYSLDADLGLDEAVINNFELADLSNTFSTLESGLTKEASFELNSDITNLNLNTGFITEHEIVNEINSNVEDALDTVDNITSEVPVMTAVDDALDSLVPELEVEQDLLDFSSSGAVDTNDNLSITNTTDLLSGSNDAESNLNIINEEGELIIDEVLNVNNNEIINSSDDVNENEANNLVNQLENSLSENTTDNNTEASTAQPAPEQQSPDNTDAIYDALAATVEDVNSVAEETFNDVNLGNESGNNTVDVVDDVGLFDNLGL